MSSSDPAQPTEPGQEPQKPLDVPGEVVERSKLAERRPDVDRLRAVRTGERSAILYVDWPESPAVQGSAPQIFDRVRAFVQATRRQDRLLEAVPMEVEVFVRAPGPELEGPSVAVLMDLSDLPMAQIEMHFCGMDTTGESLDWFIDVVVAGTWKLVEAGL